MPVLAMLTEHTACLRLLTRHSTIKQEECEAADYVRNQSFAKLSELFRTLRL